MALRASLRAGATVCARLAGASAPRLVRGLSARSFGSNKVQVALASAAGREATVAEAQQESKPETAKVQASLAALPTSDESEELLRIRHSVSTGLVGLLLLPAALPAAPSAAQ